MDAILDVIFPVPLGPLGEAVAWSLWGVLTTAFLWLTCGHLVEAPYRRWKASRSELQAQSLRVGERRHAERRATDRQTLRQVYPDHFSDDPKEAA